MFSRENRESVNVVNAVLMLHESRTIVRLSNLYGIHDIQGFTAFTILSSRPFKRLYRPNRREQCSVERIGPCALCSIQCIQP